MTDLLHSPKASVGGGPPLILRAPFKEVRRARQLRKEMNLPEVLQWDQLRQRPDGLKFMRQNPQIGYKIDFCCLSHRVAVEVDGEIHDRGDQPGKDDRRDERLDRRGFATLRIPARLILRDLDAAITGVVAFCRERAPLHHRPAAFGPPPRAGEDL